ncbi:MAG: hypothetical protein ACPHXR_08330, partial [Flavicella sp.]
MNREKHLSKSSIMEIKHFFYNYLLQLSLKLEISVNLESCKALFLHGHCYWFVTSASRRKY